MEQEKKDYFDLLHRINEISIDRKPIWKYFSSMHKKEHSLWTSQQFHLREEVKAFSKYKDIHAYKKTQKKSSVLGMFARGVWYPIALTLSGMFLLRLRFGHTQVLTYSPDKLKKGTSRDPRLFDIYNALDQSNTKFIEVIHTLFEKDFLQNVWMRKRSVLYLEVLTILHFFFKERDRKKKYISALEKASLDSFDDFEKPFVRYVFDKYTDSCFLSDFKIGAFIKILKKGSIKAIFSIDDFRYANELIVAGQVCGIETYYFQHSNFDWLLGLDSLPSEIYAFPDTFFLWNDYWQNRIQELSPLFAYHKNRLLIGGRTNGYRAGKVLPKRDNADSTINILVPYEVNVDKKVITEYTHSLAACPGAHVIFKGRPDMPEVLQANEYGMDELVKEGKGEVKTYMNDDELSKIDMVVGVYTTLVDEMIERGKPAALLEFDYPLFNDISESGLAEKLDKDDPNFCKTLKEIANTPDDTLHSRRKTFTKETGDIAKTISDILM